MTIGISPRTTLLTSVLCVFLTSFPASSNQNAVKTHIVEVAVYVDSTAYDRWKKLSGSSDQDMFKTEIKSLFVETREIYKSLIPLANFTFDFDVVDVVITDDTLIKKGTNTNNALKEFHSWRIFQPVKSDLSVMFIGNKLAKRKRGAAYIGQACRYFSLAVLYYSGNYDDVIALTHEIGHSLGGRHDNDRNKKDPCYMNSGKIMNPWLDSVPKITNFQFSECSAEYFRKYMNKINDDGFYCLSNGRPVSAPRFGQLVTPEDICIRRHSNNYSPNPDHYQNGSVDDCVTLQCKMENKSYSRKARAPPGFSCGRGKMCLQGECVVKGNATPIPPVSITPDTTTSTTSTTHSTTPIPPTTIVPDTTTSTTHSTTPIPPTTIVPDTTTSTTQSTTPNPPSPIVPDTTTRTPQSTTPHKMKSTLADDMCKKMVGSDKAQLSRGAYSTYGDRFCQRLVCVTGSIEERIKRHVFSTPDGLPCGKNKRCYNNRCENSRQGNPPNPDKCPYGDTDLLALGYDIPCSEQPCKNWTVFCCKSCPL